MSSAKRDASGNGNSRTWVDYIANGLRVQRRKNEFGGKDYVITAPPNHRADFTEFLLPKDRVTVKTNGPRSLVVLRGERYEVAAISGDGTVDVFGKGVRIQSCDPDVILLVDNRLAVLDRGVVVPLPAKKESAKPLILERSKRIVVAGKSRVLDITDSFPVPYRHTNAPDRAPHPVDSQIDSARRCEPQPTAS